MNRREAFRAAAAAFPFGVMFGAQSSAREQLKRKDLMTENLGALGGEQLVTVTELEYAPGGVSEAHRHNGHTFVYVVSGALVTKIDDGPEKVYRPGEMFYEPPLHLHSVSRNASSTEPAKFVVFRVIEKGKPGTVPPK